ncbi:hypothetical protein BIY31_14835 [Gibbsiella quercinecans]|nr:hypothetical protein BIY31_14835 [Gibbsiella quercinecans]
MLFCAQIQYNQAPICSPNQERAALTQAYPAAPVFAAHFLPQIILQAVKKLAAWPGSLPPTAKT